MQFQLEKQGQVINLHEPPLALGGEAYLYAVPGHDGIVAKIYHKPTEEMAAKLAAMIANPPDDPMAARGHASIAWPIERLFSNEGERFFAGFIMPRVLNTFSIFEFYNPRTRREKCPLFHYRYLIRTARNLAAAFRALHLRGYMVGDVNESNILVSETALVTLVDTDSFQVPAPGRSYRCPVGKPEFTPPELQNVHFCDVDRTPVHDAFGLGVLIFLLLMEGTHPYAGRYMGDGEPAALADRIAAGYYPYGIGLNIPYEPMPSAPPVGLLHPGLRALMRRCFENGQTHPDSRPNAAEWVQALDTAENNLRMCRINPQHFFRVGFGVCPWCERTKRLGGWDPFPSREAVKSGEYLRPLRPGQAPPATAQDTMPEDV